MKNPSQIIILLLAVALIVLSIKVITIEKAEPTTASSDSMSAIEAIMTRTSVRSYTSQPVEQEKIDIMLRAAMAAPTAGNRQPWQFVVVDDKSIIDQFPDIITHARMSLLAPLAIVACGEPAKSFPGVMSDYWIQDVSAATENLLLAAHASGLGAVWCGAYPDQDGRIARLQNLLELPEDVIPLNIIVIGYPDTEPNIKDKWAPEKVSYNRFGNHQ